MLLALARQTRLRWYPLDPSPVVSVARGLPSELDTAVVQVEEVAVSLDQNLQPLELENVLDVAAVTLDRDLRLLELGFQLYVVAAP